MTTCKLKIGTYGKVYFVDGKEVDEWTYVKGCAKEAAEMRRATTRQNGRRFRAPGAYGDFGDFRRDRDRKTGCDGRYFGQLARFPGDKRAVFPTKRAALEAAARRGMVEDKS